MIDTREGFDTHLLARHKDQAKRAYPELAAEIDAIVAEKGDELCCGGKSAAGKAIANLLMSFKYDGRDLSPLDNIVEGAALKLLRGEVLEPAESRPTMPLSSQHAILSSCADCVAEHIAEAILFAFEAEHGYPWKRHLVVASLEHAAFESLSRWPDFSDECHAVKIAYRNKNRYDLEKLLREADALK